MPKKFDVEKEIIDFFNLWDFKKLSNFVRDLIPLIDLYDTRIEEDAVKEFISDQDQQNVILLRTAYLLSIIADNHTSILSSTKIRHGGLYKRLKKEAVK